MGFIPCKAEKPQQGKDLQKTAEKKDDKHKRKFFRKNTKIKGTYQLKSLVFRLKVKGNHSVGKEFQSLAVRWEKVLAYTC